MIIKIDGVEFDVPLEPKDIFNLSCTVDDDLTKRVTVYVQRDHGNGGWDDSDDDSDTIDPTDPTAAHTFPVDLGADREITRVITMIGVRENSPALS